MKHCNWLISWVGEADHRAAETQTEEQLGPIASSLMGQEKFDKVHLLTNYPYKRTQDFRNWLVARVEYSESDIEITPAELKSPVDYDAIYAVVFSFLTGRGLPSDGVSLTFHLSPGTPAMAVVWIVLSQTCFPARLIQTTKTDGVLEVTFFTQISDAFLPQFLRRNVARINRLATEDSVTPAEFAKILHSSPSVRLQIDLAHRIAVHDVPVLILGETGTGKELFAEAIHRASRRCQGRFIAANCGAIAPELANSELFGHVRGSFTGAIASRRGLFVEAQSGTLFLDEIGDLPLEAQVRLLRVLESHTVTPLGASKAIEVDVRILAATNRNLMAEVQAGRFREDLFHRLAVGIINLPPLRDRVGDIDLLLDSFLDRINSDSRGKPEALEKYLSEGAREVFRSHLWPGNVRELYHTILRAAIWSMNQRIEAFDAKAAILSTAKESGAMTMEPLGQGFNLENVIDHVKRHYIEIALRQEGGRKMAAAKLLGLPSHQTLSNWMKRLNIFDAA